ncbi:hypothetical protein Q5H93_21605 [Hymenobacter sp. ASUV-10]|uniref:Uncharacterized protein n=1 Tax=Hymenobacter aranciens TaxID=3063996 RepID=A0ABT9BGF8_9BACT|nr:hypothetical protein [Hymenobacter sp. ASUV-10]
MNPFAVQTPEDISAQEAFDLFVDVFTDFNQVRLPGHTFLHGPRGSGKSMMFRFMLPDCQMLNLKQPLPQHNYFSVYIPVKKTGLNLIDLGRIDQHAKYLLNEHLLVSYISGKVFSFLVELSKKHSIFNEHKGAIARYIKKFFNRVISSGYTGPMPVVTEGADAPEMFAIMADICDGLYLDVLQYVRKLIFISNSFPPYSGSICGYLDFLYPLLCELRALEFMPKAPIFLLIDDADNLNISQTTILNTWVSYRTTADVSLKISTQLNYVNFKTISGIPIESPHDYNEVNTETIYTSSKDKYKERVSAIVKKRLENAGINKTAEEFFPVDKVQEAKIKEFADRIISGEIVTPNGRDTDKAYRYAASEYIKSLRGMSKSGMTYRYAGFKSIVNISSGVIRHFLELASRMYSEKLADAKATDYTVIEPSIQNRVVRNYSEEIILNDFNKKIEEINQEEEGVELNLTKNAKLRNLIYSMGGAFQAVLLSDGSQRRIFSIALSDTPDKEVNEILKLGVRYGFFQEATIGNKEGTGRTKRYVLNRRLAPAFSLLPTSFAGYLFITNKDLKTAIANPKYFVSQFKKKKSWIDSPEPVKKPQQGNLFSTDDE